MCVLGGGVSPEQGRTLNLDPSAVPSQEPTCGRSPLHLAVEAQSADVLELLLRAGADPTARMYGGRTPLGCAMLRPNPALVHLLREHGAPEPEEDEDDKPSLCSSSSDCDSDSDSGDEGVSWGRAGKEETRLEVQD